MKLLKIWGWILFAAAVILHLIGMLGGEYSQYGLYGKSDAAMLLSVFSVMCLLLSVTVAAVTHALGERQNKQ